MSETACDTCIFRSRSRDEFPCNGCTFSGNGCVRIEYVEDLGYEE